MKKTNFNIIVIFNKVARLAKEQIEPNIKKMEDQCDVLPEIRDLLFKNGVSYFYKTFLFDSIPIRGKIHLSNKFKIMIHRL